MYPLKDYWDVPFMKYCGDNICIPNVIIYRIAVTVTQKTT